MVWKSDRQKHKRKQTHKTILCIMYLPSDIVFSRCPHSSITSSNRLWFNKMKEKNQSNNNNIQYQISIRHIFVMAFCCNFANFPSIFFCCISAFGLLYSGNCSGVVILAVETLLLLSGQDIKTVFVVVFEETAH